MFYDVRACLTSNTIMFSILAIMAIFLSYQLYKLTSDRTNILNFTDLITEDNRLSERKFMRFGTWLITSWGFVYMISADKLEDWYFYGYLAAWVTNGLLAKYIVKGGSKREPKSTENVENTQ
jgi:hypothetical protein